MARLLLAAAFLPRLIRAYLQANYPLSSQFLPVAHVNSAFSFQFAPTTFLSDANGLQYSVVSGPSWLSLDGNTRTLSGTPRASDVGELSFKIAAAGSAGAVVDMDTKVMVSSETGPQAQGNVTEVLSKAGQLSSPRTLSIGPSKPFNITFPLDTFNSNGKSLSYDALLSDRTPLPAWISFDASSLHFAGTTPPTGSTASFDITLIAIDTPGYAASTTSFTIAVSNHQLRFQPFSQSFHMSKGNDVHITGLKSMLFLDGIAIQDHQIQAISANLPSWLKLDNSTAEISGTAPSGTMSQDVTVTAKDQFGDVAQFNVHLAFRSELFGYEIGQLNVTGGEKFEYVLPQGTFAQENGKISVDFVSLSKYLQFDPATSTISGTVPKDFTSQKVQCALLAISSDGAMQDSQTFQIAILEPTTTAPAGTKLDPNHKDYSGRTAGIVLGSIVGAVSGILLLITLVSYLRRRKRNQSYLSPKLPRNPRKSDISQPTFIPYGWPDVIMEQEEDLEKGKEAHDEEPLVKQTPDHPPKLDLELPVDRSDSHSLTDTMGDADTRILDTFEESSFGYQNDIAPSQHPHDSMKIPTELAKRASQKSDSFRRHKRRTTTVYQDQIHRSSGLPVNRRITGMSEHGRHVYSLSRSNTNFSRSSNRRPPSTSSYTTTRCTSTFSTAPSTFPQPPLAQQRTAQVTTPTEARRSIRIVPASRRSSRTDHCNWDERLNTYIRKRASAQSPFFSAAASRESSSTYKSPPAFITEVPTLPWAMLPPIDNNTIVRPDNVVMEGRDKKLPGSKHNRESFTVMADKTPARQLPSSIRQDRVARPYTSAGVSRDRVEKSYAKPTTKIESGLGGMRRRASTRDSLKAYELKAKLNDLTGSQIFKDAELSDSVYTDEEEDIEEAERRETIMPGHFTLPPLNVDTRQSKCDSAEKKRASEHNSYRKLKQTSERDPAPYYLQYHDEHGGKENQSSTYNLDTKPSTTRVDTQTKPRPLTSPERRKPSARHYNNASDARKSQFVATKMEHTSKALSFHSNSEPPKERHSRKSLQSRSQSRHSGGQPHYKKHHDHSRTQSTAYPYFDVSSLELRSSSYGNSITTSADAACTTESSTKPSITRDLSGNLTFYDVDEEPEIEELRSSSIGFRTSNGRVNSMMARRQSRLASLHESSRPQIPKRSSKRNTAVTPPCPSNAPTPVRPAGLGLFPVDARAELCRSAGSERRPLSTLQVESEGQAQERQTWGSWKSVLGKGGRLISGGYWAKQDDDDKVFI